VELLVMSEDTELRESIRAYSWRSQWGSSWNQDDDQRSNDVRWVDVKDGEIRLSIDTPDGHRRGRCVGITLTRKVLLQMLLMLEDAEA
jgi:hypothetical protein